MHNKKNFVMYDALRMLLSFTELCGSYFSEGDISMSIVKNVRMLDIFHNFYNFSSDWAVLVTRPKS